MTAAGQPSWNEFAIAIVEEACQNRHKAAWITAATGGNPLIAKSIAPIPTTDYPTAARRPAYLLLSSSRLTPTFSVQLSDWRLAMRAAFRSD
jgi:dTDP-4-dehydrorhamnose reductase